MFQIGTFPWFAIAITALYFLPAWPRRLSMPRQRPDRDRGSLARDPEPPPLRTGQYVTATLLCLYFVVQILLPLRHFLYPGEVS